MPEHYLITRHKTDSIRGDLIGDMLRDRDLPVAPKAESLVEYLKTRAPSEALTAAGALVGDYDAWVRRPACVPP